MSSMLNTIKTRNLKVKKLMNGDYRFTLFNEKLSNKIIEMRLLK